MVLVGLVTRDTGVAILSDALLGKRVLLAISGGIAAVESVRLARELPARHQADLTVIMSEEATKIITPLAVSWGSDTIVHQGWASEMSQLDDFDVTLITCYKEYNFKAHTRNNGLTFDDGSLCK